MPPILATIKGALTAIGLVDWLKGVLNDWMQRQQGREDEKNDIRKEALQDAQEQATAFAAPSRDKSSVIKRMRERANAED